MFNIEEFDIKLDTEFVGRNFVYCDEIESTNSALLNGKEYGQNGTVLLAEFQSMGRGRKDRTWVSNSGQNLTFSILLKENLGKINVNILNLGTSVAIAQAIENLYQLKVELKWPNDILVSGRKTAGILLESTSKGSKLSRLVIGIGINVNQPNFTGKFEIPATSIRREFNALVSREKLLSEVLNNFEETLTTVKYDPAKILNDWKLRCKMLGEKIKIIEGEKSLFGIFTDIDENGFLLLKTGEKTERIHYGDVSLR